MPFLDNPLQEPLDPTYVAFRDGLLNAINDLADAHRWRWSPRKKAWAEYPASGWIMDEVGIADTPAGSGLDQLFNAGSPEVAKARASYWLPPVFKEVQGAYARHEHNWPDLVWSWRGGGDWRNATKRPDGPIKDGGDRKLDPECEKRIEDVRSFQARGDITAAQAQKIIAKIVEDCTGTAD
jgi:hypothetical protein